MFKSVCVAVCVAVAGLSLGALPQDAMAKRLAAGKPAGMQRAAPQESPTHVTPQSPAQQAQPGVPSRQQATPQQSTPMPAQPQRSWLGPLAGLAAGVGLAALLSHLGVGEGLAGTVGTLLMMGLLIGGVLWMVRKLVSNPAPAPRPVGAGAATGWVSAPAGGVPAEGAAATATAATAAGGLGAAAGATAAGLSAAAPAAASGVTSVGIPADFDVAGFERLAKMVFIRMQAANDAADVDDLRKFTTPELFSSLRLDLQERGNARQQTDVVQLNASLSDMAVENGQEVASVRFWGLIREEAGQAAGPFDEFWHMVRPKDGSRDWLIAGITPA